MKVDAPLPEHLAPIVTLAGPELGIYRALLAIVIRRRGEDFASAATTRNALARHAQELMLQQVLSAAAMTGDPLAMVLRAMIGQIDESLSKPPIDDAVASILEIPDALNSARSARH